MIEVNEIAVEFSISNQTARRDIEYLHDLGLLKRVYGGTDSTVTMFIRRLESLINLTVITDSLHVAIELMDTQFNIVPLGGLQNTDEIDFLRTKPYAIHSSF